MPENDYDKGTQGSQSINMLRQLNDVTFMEYHLFGSEAHIVFDAQGKPDGDAAPVLPPTEQMPLHLLQSLSRLSR